MMKFWVFSYNRGNFLKNCIRSIERCAPQSTINIFDDNSSDPETQVILQELAVKHQVHYPAPGPDDGGKHGGLYNNMQTALSRASEEDIVCFLQDDMQVVRELGEDDLAAITTYYSAEPKAGFMQPTFLKGCTRKKDECLTRYAKHLSVYYVDRFKNSAGAYYSDVFIARVDRLRQVDWAFYERESGNEQQARQHFAQLAHLRNPWLAYLPNGPAYRGKTQTLALRWAHRQRSCGFYPFQTLSQEESQQFKQRDGAIFPYAEDFLSVGEHPLRKPWIYYPLQGSSLLKNLDRLERKLVGWVSH